MINFFIHDARGVILRTGKAPESMVDLQAQDGEFVLRGAADDSTQYVVDGELATYTEEELTSKNNLQPGWAWSMPERIAVRTDTLDRAKARKIEEFNEACTREIVAGFVSEALGAPHLYPAKPQDQANLVASVTDSLLAAGTADWATPFWCCDESGFWDYRPHTIDQIQRVGREAKAAILQALGKNEALRRQIDVATIEQLQDIHWTPS